MLARGAAALCLSLVLAGAEPAGATFPGLNGLVAFDVRTGDGPYAYNIYAANPDGTGLRALTSTPDRNAEPTWSPDGTKLAFASNRDGNFEIYVINADGTGLRRLTNDPGSDYQPAWSPDGTRIAFAGTGGIKVMSANGTDRASIAFGGDPAWSPDGRRIAFVGSGSQGAQEIFVVGSSGGAAVNVTNSAPASEESPDWSPDGQKIVFARRADLFSGDSDIWVMNADGSQQSRLTSWITTDCVGPFCANRTTGELRPAWSPDGTRLAFVGPSTQFGYALYMMAADGSGVTPVGVGAADNPSWQRIRPTIDLAVTQRVAPRVGRVGKPLTLTATVRNGSADSASGVVLSVTPPNGARVVRVRNAGATCTRSTPVTCRWAELRGSATVVVTVRATRATRGFSVATVRAANPDPRAGNNKSRVRVVVR